MTKKNPDDSVRDEQFGADENAPIPEEATQAETAKEPETKTNSEVRDEVSADDAKEDEITSDPEND